MPKGNPPLRKSNIIRTLRVSAISVNRLGAIKHALLTWYDKHRRVLPWRAVVGKVPNPYHVFISEFMLQQTTVGAVKGYFERFLDKWPTMEHLACADEHDILTAWQGLGYYSRARNLYKSAQILSQMGRWPKTPNELKNLPGVGDYTAAAVASIAFDYPIVPIDGNVVRVMGRVFGIEDDKEGIKKTIALVLSNFICPIQPGNFAQALMDLGATVCTTTNAKCGACPLALDCQAYKDDTVYNIPAKRVVTRPKRYTNAFCLFNQEGAVLLYKNPPKGLLGGMMMVPTSSWQDTQVLDRDFMGITWRKCTQPVVHTFTHFQLNVDIYVATTEDIMTVGEFVPLDAFHLWPVATLTKKILKCGGEMLTRIKS